jgi:hypothetical protein
MANGIKSEEDAKKLVEVCVKLLNDTWLESAMRTFDAGKGEEKHILTYNGDRSKALSVCTTAVAELLTMLGQRDDIDPAIKGKITGTAQGALKNILDSLNEKVLFRNVKNDLLEAKKACQQITQLTLYLASQQSRLVGGPEKLSAKWCTNVIVSLTECSSESGGTSGRSQFSRHLISAELRPFCADFVPEFSKHAKGAAAGILSDTRARQQGI